VNDKPTIQKGVLCFGEYRILFTPDQSAMLEAYIARMPEAVSDDVVAMAVWGGLDEPENAINVLAVQRTKMRSVLARIGLALRRNYGHGTALVVGDPYQYKPRKQLPPSTVQKILAKPNSKAETLARELGISGPTVAKYRRMHGQR